MAGSPYVRKQQGFAIQFTGINVQEVLDFANQWGFTNPPTSSSSNLIEWDGIFSLTPGQWLTYDSSRSGGIWLPMNDSEFNYEFDLGQYTIEEN